MHIAIGPVVVLSFFLDMNKIKSFENIFPFIPFLAGKKLGGEKHFKNLQQGKKTPLDEDEALLW